MVAHALRRPHPQSQDVLSRFPLHPAHNVAMRMRGKIALAMLLVALAGVSAWQGLRVREPVLSGQTVERLAQCLQDCTGWPV